MLRKMILNSKEHRLVILLIVCLMITNYLFANTVCIPALPSIRSSLNTSLALSQEIVICYVLMLGLSQLIYGPLADVYGRRKIVLCASLIFILGGVVAIFAKTIVGILFGRVLQGLGGGSFSVVGKAIASDIYKDKDYVNATVLIMFCAVIAQMLAPAVGGYLVDAICWQGIFTAILLYGTVTFLCVLLFLPETKLSADSFGTASAFVLNYKSVLTRSFNFWLLLLISTLALAAITLYQIVSPFILQDTMRLTSAENGWASFATASGFLVGLIILNTINKHLDNWIILAIGMAVMLSSAVGMFFLPFLSFANPFDLIIPMAIFNVGTGIIFPLATASALLEHSKLVGTAGALIGCLQMIMVAGICMAGAGFHIHESTSLAIGLLLISVLCWSLLLCKRFGDRRYIYQFIQRERQYET